MTLGGVLGLKRIVQDAVALLADVVIRERGAYGLEFSLERDCKNGWSLGPGLSISRSGNGANGLGVAFGMALFQGLRQLNTGADTSARSVVATKLGRDRLDILWHDAECAAI